MIKIASPLSHFFEDDLCTARIVSNSDCLEVRREMMDSTLEGQELFHCELQPIHNLTGTDIGFLKRIKDDKKDLKLITFHIASCCDRPYLRDYMYEMGGREYSPDEMLENARRNIDMIREIFGSGVSIAVENTNYYPTDAYDHITDPEFITQLIYENDINLLLDIAHAKITSYNRKKDYEDYIAGLPLDKTLQMHISRFGINEHGIAYDAHDCPDDNDLEEVKHLIGRLDNTSYLTIEYYKNIDLLIAALTRLKSLI